jgi:hypothetical protein
MEISEELVEDFAEFFSCLNFTEHQSLQANGMKDFSNYVSIKEA